MYFDGSDVQDGNVIPEGEYPCVIVASEDRANKGDGNHLYLEFEVTDGQYKGHKLFERLNVSHPNETAQRIGQQNLKKLCKAALGTVALERPDQLCGKKVNLRLGIRYDDYRDEDVNNIKKFLAYSEEVEAEQAVPF